jgi:hypothetical protein
VDFACGIISFINPDGTAGTFAIDISHVIQTSSSAKYIAAPILFHFDPNRDTDVEDSIFMTQGV